MHASSDFEPEAAGSREHDFLDRNVERLSKAGEGRRVWEGLHLAGSDLLDPCPGESSPTERGEPLVRPIAFPISHERLQRRVLNVHGHTFGCGARSRPAAYSTLRLLATRVYGWG